MAKTKTTSMEAKPDKVKPKTSKSKSKDLTKQVAAKATNGTEGKKASKKSKKEPTPEPSSDESESESDEEASDDSSAHSDEGSDSDSGSDSSSDAESSASEAKVGTVENPKANGYTKMDISSETIEGDADTSESSESSASSVSSEDDEESEKEVASAPKAVNGNTKKIKVDKASSDSESAESGSSDSESDSASDSDDDDSEESDEEEAPVPKKRKAEEIATPMAKKTKTDDEAAGAKTNLFVGQLSWNVDNDWLTREFEPFGQLESARVMMDRDSGRSRGFGYVEFASEADAQKALEAMTGKEIDGRPIKLDLAEKRKPANSTPGFQDREKKYGDREKSAPADTLFVGNLPFGITQDVVWEAFKEHGEPTSVRLPTDRDSGEPKGFGYVSFGSIDEATKVLNSMNGEYVGDRPIRLDFSGPRPDNGGARGGRGGGFGDRGGRGGRGGRGRGGFDRGGRGGDRGGRGGSTNRGGFSDFKGKKMTF